MSPPRRRVAIDAHTIGRRATGNETYVRGLLAGLGRQSEIEPLALLDAGVAPPEGITTRILASTGAPARLLRDLARPGRRWRSDLLHVQYVRPPRCDVPVVTTIHDISFEHHREMFTRRTALRMRITIPWSARHSAAVLTGSNYSRQDLIETYRLPAERVHVTPYAADGRFRHLDPEAVRDILRPMALPSGFLLCVGNLQPRKNLRRLLEAFVAVRQSGADLPLVVVGQPAWRYAEVFEAVRRHDLESSVIFTGFVSDDQLVALYNAAAMFIYPSLFEGFGLPVLEALACGAPTIASKTTSIPEVAGEAALLVDPTRTDEIAGAMLRLLDDSPLAARLAQAGPKRAAGFSWDTCASATVAAYRAVLGW